MFLPGEAGEVPAGRRVMGPGIGVAHDPSVAVGRRHLPALRAGRNDQSVSIGSDSVFAHSPIEPS
jgi:hypothetical protein